MTGNNGELVAALVELRDATSALIGDLERGVCPSVERWFTFADLIAVVVTLCRRTLLGGNSGDEPCARQ